MPATAEFDRNKLETYIRAIERLAVREKALHPKNRAWAGRLDGMARSTNHKRYAWLRFVEKNKDTIGWCGELSAMLVTMKLKGERYEQASR